MRVLAIAALLEVGCGGPSAPVASRPRVAVTCAAAAEHVIELLAAPLDPRPPQAKIDELVGVLRAHCEQDGWSVEARECLHGLRRRQDAERCASLLTPAQAEALAVGDQRRRADADAAAPADASGAP